MVLKSNHIKCSVRKGVLGVSIALFLSGASFAGDDESKPDCKKGHRGPPPAAIEACDGLAVDQACEFVSPRGDSLSGVCGASPRNEDAPLACRPDHRPRHSKHDEKDEKDT